jgi:hypothetical protein
MKLEFAVVFAEMQRDIEAARTSGASKKAEEKMRLKTNADDLQRHAMPKVVTSSTANLEEIPQPEKITAGAVSFVFCLLLCLCAVDELVIAFFDRTKASRKTP